MKILLTTLNSKFIHSNLALHYMKACHEANKKNSKNVIDLELKEYTINNDLDDVLWDLFKGHYDIIFVSAYIWNIEALDVLLTNLKKVQPKVKIILGGPEVTFDPSDQIIRKNYLDGIIIGEGEKTFLELIEVLSKSPSFFLSGEKLAGLIYKLNDLLVDGGKRPLIENLDDIPFPYSSLSDLNHRILYYETTRGCPYNCAYCLSSALKSVRYFSIERIKKDLKFFLDSNVPQVKFVDRTFNLNKEHALPILAYLLENDNGITNFHFETTASLLDEDYFDLIRRSRNGLFQFEIGVQSTNETTLQLVNRSISLEKLIRNTEKLLEIGVAHVHLDLIAGLPGEGYDRFLKSFDDVYKIGADHLQVGFLKLLKGTPLYQEREKYGYIVRNQAPYEVLSNASITFEELSKLKEIEKLVESYHNSGKFKQSLLFLMQTQFERPSQMFEMMQQYWHINNYYDAPVSGYKLYEVVYDFYSSLKNVHEEQREIFKDLLKLDYYVSKMKGQKPLFAYSQDEKFNAKRLHLLKNTEWLSQNAAHYVSHSAKQILKNVEFVFFQYDIIAMIESGYQKVRKEGTIIMIDFGTEETAFSFPMYSKIPSNLWEGNL